MERKVQIGETPPWGIDLTWEQKRRNRIRGLEKELQQELVKRAVREKSKYFEDDRICD